MQKTAEQIADDVLEKTAFKGRLLQGLAKLFGRGGGAAAGGSKGIGSIGAKLRAGDYKPLDVGLGKAVAARPGAQSGTGIENLIGRNLRSGNYSNVHANIRPPRGGMPPEAPMVRVSPFAEKYLKKIGPMTS